MNDLDHQEYHLQKPGAGLPWWELLVARYIIFPRTCRRLNWAAASSLFQEEGSKVLAIWNSLSAEQLTKRVLIRRICGIEDSSRYWSVAMTVEHLNIVGMGIRDLIERLRRRDAQLPFARIQDVKPSGLVPQVEVVGTFVQLLADAAGDRQPAVPPSEGPSAPHPWFGPIDAHQWNCLLGMHQQIHRRQIEAILKCMHGS